MNSVTTLPESRQSILNGWLISLVLHSLLLWVAITWGRQLPIAIPVKPFQWDVTLIHSTEFPKGSPLPTEEAPQPVGGTHSPHPTAATRSARSSAHHTDNASGQSPIDKPIPAMLAPTPPSSVVQTESTSTNSGPSVPQTTPVARQHLESSPSTTPEAPSAPATIETSSPSMSEPAADPVQADQPPALAATQADSGTPSRADYSWLQQMIFRRLEDLKRASRPQLDDFRPLKVLVKAVVSQDGRLLGSEVIKSSGLDRIDQEAVALVQRAFPMQFDRTIDRRQIVMRIPISYSRE